MYMNSAPHLLTQDRPEFERVLDEALRTAADTPGASRSALNSDQLRMMALSAAAASINPEQIEREYFDLFVGLGRGELFPYASYYLTGYLYGRPLARVRETLKQLGLERIEGQSEPEDHAAILLEVMAGLANGQIVAPGETARDIFETHLKPWIGRFFSDLEHAQAATFYACVGTLGRIFTEVEAEAFSLSK